MKIIQDCKTKDQLVSAALTIFQPFSCSTLKSNTRKKKSLNHTPSQGQVDHGLKTTTTNKQQEKKPNRTKPVLLWWPWKKVNFHSLQDKVWSYLRFREGIRFSYSKQEKSLFSFSLTKASPLPLLNNAEYVELESQNEKKVSQNFSVLSLHLNLLWLTLPSTFQSRVLAPHPR